MRTNHAVISICTLAMGLLTTGCASMTKAEIDKPSVQRIKNVAIVGLHLEVQEPKTLMGEISKVKDGVSGKFRDANEEHVNADHIYAELQGQLTRKMKWNVQTAAAVSRSTGYKALLNQYTKGLQVSGGMRSEGYHKIRPHGILDATPFIQKISAEDRDALMNELGVDAVVVDMLTVNVPNNSFFGFVGVRKYQPKAQNIIRVFQKGRKDPVWFDTWAWGEADKEITGDMIGDSDVPLQEQVVIASKKAVGETFQRFQTH